MRGIRRVLVANRGEIAVRIIRACQALRIESVLVASEADRETMAARMADKVLCIGPPPPLKSYLKVDTIVAAALGSGADAIHPGYGFLAEQPELGDLCAKHGIVFIGPTPENIRQMGDKLFARREVQKLSVPVIPGSGLVCDDNAALSAAEQVGFPVLLKAAAGGGGKGMKTVNRASELKGVFEEASAEARASFGDERIYMERFIPNARHIEVQVLADRSGNAIHLFERDCSLQRRYQKMIEEAPSPVLDTRLRNQICEAALRIVESIRYLNAGTVEFMFDQDQGIFYFLEMNTRIQVEHPVTEMITGVDIVKEQIRIAGGEMLSLSQEQVSVSGHAIECRINAESPNNNFSPSPGRITEWMTPEGDGVRVDSHCFSGYFVPPFYDSLLAKLIVKANDRGQAIEHTRNSLNQFVVRGIDTTIPLYQSILENPDYIKGSIHTRWIEDVFLKS